MPLDRPQAQPCTHAALYSAHNSHIVEYEDVPQNCPCKFAIGRKGKDHFYDVLVMGTGSNANMRTLRAIDLRECAAGGGGGGARGGGGGGKRRWVHLNWA
jgi:hypothetical protein